MSKEEYETMISEARRELHTYSEKFDKVYNSLAYFRELMKWIKSEVSHSGANLAWRVEVTSRIDKALSIEDEQFHYKRPY